jgi:hypothetical protein
MIRSTSAGTRENRGRGRRHGGQAGTRRVLSLDWGYNASALGRVVAREWIDANDCDIVATITIDENSLVVTNHASGRHRVISITVNRLWDLGADLAEAVSQLRERLGQSPA